ETAAVRTGAAAEVEGNREQDAARTVADGFARRRGEVALRLRGRGKRIDEDGKSTDRPHAVRISGRRPHLADRVTGRRARGGPPQAELVALYLVQQRAADVERGGVGGNRREGFDG